MWEGVSSNGTNELDVIQKSNRGSNRLKALLRKGLAEAHTSQSKAQRNIRAQSEAFELYSLQGLLKKEQQSCNQRTIS